MSCTGTLLRGLWGFVAHYLLLYAKLWGSRGPRPFVRAFHQFARAFLPFERGFFQLRAKLWVLRGSQSFVRAFLQFVRAFVPFARGLMEFMHSTCSSCGLLKLMTFFSSHRKKRLSFTGAFSLFFPMQASSYIAFPFQPLVQTAVYKNDKKPVVQK